MALLFYAFLAWLVFRLFVVVSPPAVANRPEPYASP